MQVADATHTSMESCAVAAAGHEVFVALASQLQIAPLRAAFGPSFLLRWPAPFFVPNRRRVAQAVA